MEDSLPTGGEQLALLEDAVSKVDTLCQTNLLNKGKK